MSKNDRRKWRRLRKCDPATVRTQHTLNRLNQRYEDLFTHQDIHHLIDMILNGEAVASHAQSCNRTVHVLRYRHQDIRVIYDKRRKIIITALNG